MITIIGCWKLLVMKKRGEELPNSWVEDITTCRKTKLRAVMLKLNKTDKLILIEIENIMRELGINGRL